MYDRRNYVGKYSSEEVQQLKSLKEKHGNDWATIGAAMGRSASSVKDRYRLMRDHCHSGVLQLNCYGISFSKLVLKSTWQQLKPNTSSELRSL